MILFEKIGPMPSIAAAEIEPGLVVFIDPTVLVADSEVCFTQDPPVARSGPFVCIAVDGDSSDWSPLTTEARSERLELDRTWRIGGHPQWTRAPQYLNDGANVWRGPNATFVSASHQEVTIAANRARLLEAGLAAIQTEIEAQRRRRSRSCGD